MIRYEDVYAWMQAQRDNIVRDMRRIVNIRSVSEPQSEVKPFGPGCRAALDEFLAMASERGFETENFNYYGGRVSLPGKACSKEIGIWCHLDVVPEGNGWSFPPFEMQERDGFLIGRGVQDNKSSAIDVLYVLQYLRERCPERRYDFSLYVGCSEENTMDDVVYMVQNVPMPALSLVADCGFPVCYGEKGNLGVTFYTGKLPDNVLEMRAGVNKNSIPDRAELTLKRDNFAEQLGQRAEGHQAISVEKTDDTVRICAEGRTAHIINPDSGENAIKLLVAALEGCDPDWKRQSGLAFLEKVDADGYGKSAGFYEEDEVSGGLVGGITCLRTENGRLAMSADYRYPVLHEGKKADGAALIEKMQKAAEENGLELRVDGNTKAVYISPDLPIVRGLTESYQKYSGFTNKPFTMSGGTYAKRLPNAFAFGMTLPGKKIYGGNGKGDYHQADESIRVEDMIKASAIYVMCLTELDVDL